MSFCETLNISLYYCHCTFCLGAQNGWWDVRCFPLLRPSVCLSVSLLDCNFMLFIVGVSYFILIDLIFDVMLIREYFWLSLSHTKWLCIIKWSQILYINNNSMVYHFQFWPSLLPKCSSYCKNVFLSCHCVGKSLQSKSQVYAASICHRIVIRKLIHLLTIVISIHHNPFGAKFSNF